MITGSRNNIFERFFKQRESLIIQYKNGDISKREYIEFNFDYIKKMNLQPFQRIDSLEKGIYTYQYYNVLAKYTYMLAVDIKKRGNHPKLYKEYIDKANYYYHLKDKTTFKLLKVIDFKNVDAYYIKVQSSYLKNKLYEIVLKDYNNIVLHSKSLWLLRILKEEGVFTDIIKKSIVDGYVNEKY
jgi:hypothetical protein